MPESPENSDLSRIQQQALEAAEAESEVEREKSAWVSGIYNRLSPEGQEIWDKLVRERYGTQYDGGTSSLLIGFALLMALGFGVWYIIFIRMLNKAAKEDELYRQSLRIDETLRKMKDDIYDKTRRGK